jgi:probable HAF family extracellular repeat protein
VAGYPNLGDAYADSYITGPAGVGNSYLGTLGGNYNFAAGVNNAGQVVGASTLTLSETGSDPYHAYITGPNGMGMKDLGPLGRGDISDINAAGQVAGYSDTGNGILRAFISAPNGVGMTDIQPLLAPHGVVRSDAVGINNLGQVIVNTSFVPEPSSYALMLARLGLGVVAGLVRLARRNPTSRHRFAALRFGYAG